jgi:hypothetical protein
MHNIQDLILTAGSLIFALALLPSIFSKNKPALSTSLLTAVVVYIFAGVYISLNLWFTAITTLITGSCWSILALQKWLQAKSK